MYNYIREFGRIFITSNYYKQHLQHTNKLCITARCFFMHQTLVLHTRLLPQEQMKSLLLV